jgi:hypothetical protein
VSRRAARPDIRRVNEIVVTLLTVQRESIEDDTLTPETSRLLADIHNELARDRQLMLHVVHGLCGFVCALEGLYCEELGIPETSLLASMGPAIAADPLWGTPR